MANDEERVVYSIVPLRDDGFGVKIQRPRQEAVVTEFRTLEEAQAWIELQKRPALPNF